MYHPLKKFSSTLFTTVVLSILSLFSVSCSSAKKLPTPVFTAPTSPLVAAPEIYNPNASDLNRLSAGNTIKIMCPEDPEIAGDFEVPQEGNLLLPYSKTVSFTGDDIATAQNKLVALYRPLFNSPPKCTISVTDDSVFIDVGGVVQKPGRVKVKRTSDLNGAIASAGGLLLAGDGRPLAKSVSVSGPGGQAQFGMIDFVATGKSPVTAWAGGEKVTFLAVGGNVGGAMDPNYVQILGQVKAPGEYPVNQQYSLLNYLIQAGGPTDRANANGILLIRKENQKAASYKFSMEEPENFPALIGGDVVFVQADNPSDMQKDASTLGSFGGFFGSISTAILLGAGL